MKYSKDPQTDRSLRHSVKDGMAHSVMAGAAETYLSAFAIFLKANASQVVLLSTLPALLGSLAQFLAAGLGRRLPRRKPVILVGATLQGLAWLPLLILPLAFPDYALPLLMGCVTLYYFCGQLTAPLWTSLMGDLVPVRRRGRFFGCRTRLTTICSFVALVSGGVVLHLFDHNGWTVGGFVVLFVIAWLARMVSVYHLLRMHEPERAEAMREHKLDREWLSAVKGSGALWFSAYFVLMQSAVAIASPLFSVYMLRDLQFSYLEYMANTGAAVLVQFLTLNTWGRIGDAFGHRLILSVTSLVVPIFPLMWIFSDNFWYLLCLQCLSGLSWGGFSLSASNLLYELVPSTQRVTYTAFHSVTTAAGVFVGGSIGAVLVVALPEMTVLFGVGVASSLLAVFIVSTVARYSVVALLLRRVREIRKPRKALSATDFVFRATRFNAFMGLAYEFVGGFRRQEQEAVAPARPATPAATERPQPSVP